MKNEFKALVESFTTMVTTQRLRYPRQIEFSGEFKEALKKEILKHKSLTESNEPINNFEEKFLKAIRFELFEHCGHCGVGPKHASKTSKMRSKGKKVRKA